MIRRHVLTAILVLLSIGALSGEGRSEISIRGCPSVYSLAMQLSAACSKGGGPKSTVSQMVTNLAIKGVQDGTVDIGMASRPLTVEERAAGLRDILVAVDGLSLFVNKDNPVEDVTRQEVGGIMRGEIRRWSDLASARGAGAPISVIHHRPECGVTMAARARFLGDLNAVLVEGKEVKACPNVVGEIMGDQWSLGYGSQLLGRGKPTIRPLRVDGVSPTPDEIRSSRYPYAFGLRLVFRAEPVGELASFLDFVKSDEGRRVIQEANYILPEK